MDWECLILMMNKNFSPPIPAMLWWMVPLLPNKIWLQYQLSLITNQLNNTIDVQVSGLQQEEGYNDLVTLAFISTVSFNIVNMV